MVPIQVQNVVASTSLDTLLPLDTLLSNLESSEYEPEQFPGLVYRLQEPRVATLIFRSGKIICVGAKSSGDATKALKKVVKQIKDVGIKVPRKYDIRVENIVVSANLNRELNLDGLAFQLESSEYEPEQFPGLVYRIYDPKVAFLLFSSGRIVCAGAKCIKDVNKAIDKLETELKKLGV